jgi:hypothetical protein
MGKRCVHIGCTKIKPNFDILGGKGRFCADHKSDDMVDVRSKQCEHLGCTKVNPKFDVSGGKGRFCADHKSVDMVDVRSKRCEHIGCTKNPAFNIAGGKGRFCADHKSVDMVDVRSKRCGHLGCTKVNPNFDVSGGKGRFCADHKSVDMVDVRSKRCAHIGCTKQPAFDIAGGKGRFCTDHKSDYMVDVKHKKCKHVGCTTRAMYGKPGSQVSHCSQHKSVGMIKRPRSKCVIKGCSEIALYGKNSVAMRCEKHMTDDDDNLIERECVSCMLPMILNKNDICEYCDPDTFKVARLAKQKKLMDYLDANGLSGYSTDKTINSGECGLERPDRMYDFGNKIVILECDEHQHRGRACVCEQTRMVNIAQSLGGTPVHFIRWNPDDYDTYSDRKLPETLPKRYKLVCDYIQDIQNERRTLPPCLVSAIYMYFDGWSGIQHENIHAVM